MGHIVRMSEHILKRRASNVRRAMTERKPPAPTPGRYNILEITQRVERERVRHGIEIKDLAERAGLTQSNWYKKAGGSAPRSPFTVEELGRIADALGAPPLWPFAEWSILERVFPKQRNGSNR